MRRTLIPLALLLCVLLAPAAASARPTVGIGDQNPTAFQDRKMHKLKHLKVARLVIEWDWYKDAQAAAHARWWMSTVTAAHMRPLITFNRNWNHSGRKKVPSLKAYKKSFKEFRRQFPKVRDFSAWNEPNAKEQPFYRKPAKAAKYFNALRSACKKCTIVAGDVNDGKNMVRWLKTYKRHLRKPKVWALHNYKDSTSKHTRGTTRTFLRTVRGSVWLTETGGLTNRGGLKGQATAVKRIFQLARSSKRIKRLYFYQWRAVRHSHWDSAFLTRKGKPRPAYYTLRFQLKRSH
jgi:hypothetical protein